MELQQTEYIRVLSVEDALRNMREHSGAIYVAGGTDVYVNRQQGNVEASVFIDLSGIAELKQIAFRGEDLEIGSGVSLDELTRSLEIRSHFPTLAEAARSVATPVIRKTATLGGNLLCENRCTYYNQSAWWRESVGYCLKCNGDICIATGGKKSCFSKFVSDTAPVLIAYDASLVIQELSGENRIGLEKLYTGDGVHSIALQKNKLLRAIVLPSGSKRVAFRKLRPRKTLDFTSLTTAVSIDDELNLRMVVGGVDPRPVIVSGNLRSDDLSNLITEVCKKPRVIENDFYPRKYRKEMIRVFIENSLHELGIQ